LRKAKYTVLVDGVIGGFGKVALAFVVAGAGAYGLFLASSIAIVFAAVASLLLILLAMRVRIELRQPLQVLKPLLAFSGANYIANIVNTVAGLVIPIILLDRLGADSAAYYFVVFQMAQLVYTAGAALEQTLLTEGSREDADMRQLRRRSLRLLVIFFVVSAVIMIGLGRWLLLAFGQPYYQHGYTTLVILVLAAAPISLNFWLQTILRLAGKLRAIIVVNTIGSVATVAGIWFGSSHGLTSVAWGWFGASLLEVVIAVIAARERPVRY
jgi:O-antigen/teichoic acid export membrane protein